MKGLKGILTGLLFCVIWACNTEDEGNPYDDHGVDIAPTISFEIDENPADGTVIGQIPGIEGSTNNQYSLLNPDPYGALEVDSVTGELIVRDSTFFNFEVHPSIIATSIVSAGEVSVQRPVHISVQDIYEEFSLIGDIVIRGQNELNAFVAGNHWAVSGSLQLISSGLMDVSRLNTLERVGSLVLNGSFTGTEGLRNIRRIEENLYISNNRSATDLSYLDLNVDYLGGHLKISGMQKLNSFQGLGLNIDELLGSLVIANNDALTQLNGLEFHTIHGSLTVDQNPNLLNFSGANVQQIMGALSLFRNTSLTSLDGLNVTHLGAIDLRRNFSLTDISALEQLETVANDIEIIDSYYLTDYCSLSSCIQNGGLGGAFLIDGNWYNPTLQQMLDGECSI